MDNTFVLVEEGKTILNKNSIAMAWADPDDPDNVTCINLIGIQKTFYIKENFESVKQKLLYM